MCPIVLRRPRHALPAPQQGKDACQIQRLGSLRHRLPKLTIKVASLLSQQRRSDRPRRRLRRILLSVELSADSHDVMIASHTDDATDRAAL